MKFNSEKKIRIFDSTEELAEKLSNEIQKEAKKISNEGRNFYLALSGGSTPALLFNRLAQYPFKESIPWNKVHIFWCDERSVPPDNPKSNYGMTKKNLFNHVQIPEENIHRIRGEKDPEQEAERYANEIKNILPSEENDLPVFDWVLLGLGSDGHTASLFPGLQLSSVSLRITGVAVHPKSGQKRISLTKEVINNSRRITFLVTGNDKAEMLFKILKMKDTVDYPAAEINPVNGYLEWMIDKEASIYL